MENEKNINDVTAAETGAEEVGAQAENDKVEQRDKTFTQADIDKIIGDRLKRESEKWQKTVEEKLTEAKKMAKMNAEEKAEYERKQAEADYQRRLAEVTARELKAEAKETLTEKQLPLELAEVLNYTDADTCKASIDAVEKAFRAAVEKGVNQRLKDSSTAPQQGRQTQSLSGLEAAFYNINPNLKK